MKEILDYFINAFRLLKKIFKEERLFVIFIFIILTFPNIYEIENLVNRLLFFPVYFNEVINYLSFRSISDNIINTGFLTKAIYENIFFLTILKIIKDTFFIFLIGKCIEKAKREKIRNNQNLLKKSFIAAIIYLFPFYLCNISSVFLIRFIPKIKIIEMLSFIMVLFVIILQIIFLYFVPVYISENISLKKGFLKSMKIGKGNRKKIFIIIPYLGILLLVSLISLFILGIAVDLLPFSRLVGQNEVPFLSFSLNRAIVYIFGINIIKGFFTVYLACLISKVYLGLKEKRLKDKNYSISGE